MIQIKLERRPDHLTGGRATTEIDGEIVSSDISHTLLFQSEWRTVVTRWHAAPIYRLLSKLIGLGITGRFEVYDETRPYPVLTGPICLDVIPLRD